MTLGLAVGMRSERLGVLLCIVCLFCDTSFDIKVCNSYVTIGQNRSPDHRAVIRGSNPAKIRRPSADLAPILDSSGGDPANLTRS